MNDNANQEIDFLETISSLTHCWNSFEDKTSEEKLVGLTFSILSYLDGSSGNCHVLIPNCNLNLKGNISGRLHEHFFEVYEKIKSSENSEN